MVQLLKVLKFEGCKEVATPGVRDGHEQEDQERAKSRQRSSKDIITMKTAERLKEMMELPMKDRGILERDKVKESKLGPMEQSTKVNLSRAKEKEKALLRVQMAAAMQGLSKKTSLAATAYKS